MFKVIGTRHLVKLHELTMFCSQHNFKQGRNQWEGNLEIPPPEIFRNVFSYRQNDMLQYFAMSKDSTTASCNRLTPRKC